MNRGIVICDLCNEHDNLISSTTTMVSLIAVQNDFVLVSIVCMAHNCAVASAKAIVNENAYIMLHAMI